MGVKTVGVKQGPVAGACRQGPLSVQVGHHERIQGIQACTEAEDGCFDADDSAAGVAGARGASRKLQQRTANKGPHLFTMGISGEIRASKLALEPDVPDRPDSYRLGVTMELVTDSLHIQVGLSSP